MFAMPGARAFTLASSRHSGSVAFDEEGVFVGGVPLLKREQTSNGFAHWSVRPLDALDAELTVVYRLPIDIARKANALARIAAALNRGDRATAAIATVHMQFPDPPPLAKGAESRAELERRAVELAQSGLLKFWDPAKHPRAGVPPNRAWFAPVDAGPEQVVVIPVADDEQEEHLRRPGHHGVPKQHIHPLGEPRHHIDMQPPLPLGIPSLMPRPPAAGSPARPPGPPPRPQAPAETQSRLPFPEGLPRQRALSPARENDVASTPARGGRLGNPPVRAQNAAIAKDLEEKEGLKVTNGDDEGPEEYIPGDGPGTKGSTYVDITAKDPKTGRTVRVQTIDTLADGKTPTPREQAATDRIRKAFPHDELRIIPKRKAP
jgi:hypothetical protein